MSSSLLVEVPQGQTTATTLSSSPVTEIDVPGWPQLARLMAEVPDLEAFSRFRELNMKNLLYYQVELADLERKLDRVEHRDWMNRTSEEGEYAKRAYKLIECQDLKDGKHEQWQLVLRIRERLSQYNAAVLQHAQLCALPNPEGLNVESLRVWIKRAACGNYCIAGPGSQAWGDLYVPEREESFTHRLLLFLRGTFWKQSSKEKVDLVTTHPRQNIDGISRWVFQEWIPFYYAIFYRIHRPGHKDPEKSPRRHPEEEDRHEEDEGDHRTRVSRVSYSTTYATVLRMAQFALQTLVAVVASILPTLAVGVLAVAEGKIERKVLYIGAFTALFAMTFMFLKDAGTSTVQVFIATATFSAVMVVFVNNQ